MSPATPSPTRSTWCPRCQARVPPGQAGLVSGRWTLYCTVCGEWYVLSARGARRATAVEARLARRGLFVARGLAEPVPGG